MTTGHVTATHDPLEQNKILSRRFFDEMWNPWNFAKADELLAPDITFQGTLGPQLKGRDAFRAYMRKVQAAFPDFHNTILELTAEDDRVVARTIYRGTHRGEIFGIAPTGKTISYAGAAFFRIAEGKIIEGWVLGDLLSVLRQLDARSIP
ncbi:MAG: ester cyclase [Candidatus Acidiferrales bacterium]